MGNRRRVRGAWRRKNDRAGPGRARYLPPATDTEKAEQIKESVPKQTFTSEKIGRSNTNILINTICFINRDKPGAEIYLKYAQRLANDVLQKTPYDFRICTNEPEAFDKVVKDSNGRVSVLHDDLRNNRVWVSYSGMTFNQLLKHIAFREVDSRYDWAMYVDCDIGIIAPMRLDLVKTMISNMESVGEDALGAISHGKVRPLVERYEEWLTHKHGREPYSSEHLFAPKFRFYEVSTTTSTDDWLDAYLPMEHLFMLRNNEKLPLFYEHFKQFCKKFETQDRVDETGTFVPFQTADMEAFEIGVSASLAGYKWKNLDSWIHHDVLGFKFNGNNWERIKL